MTAPAAPKGLGTKGKKLWKQITKDFELRPDELCILEDACREIDLVERLQAAIDKQGFSLREEGSMGQPVAAPELAEIRHHRAAFQKAIAALKLPADDQAVRPGNRSTSARAAASARWHMPSGA